MKLPKTEINHEFNKLGKEKQQSILESLSQNGDLNFLKDFPNDNVIPLLNYDVILVSGETGKGKSFLADKLIKYNKAFSNLDDIDIEDDGTTQLVELLENSEKLIITIQSKDFHEKMLARLKSIVKEKGLKFGVVSFENNRVYTLLQ